MAFLKSPTSHYSKMISWAHDGEAMSPPVACHSVFAGFTVYRSPIHPPLSLFKPAGPFASCWELDLAKPRALREAAPPPQEHAAWWLGRSNSLVHTA